MADIPRNIARFNLITVTLFGLLYEKFPLKRDISTFELVEIATDGLPTRVGETEDEVAFSDTEVAERAIEWLRDEGFITFDSSYLSERTFLEVTLTGKALAVLNAVPSPLRQPSEPTWEILKRATIEKVPETVAHAISVILTMGMRHG